MEVTVNNVTVVITDYKPKDGRLSLNGTLDNIPTNSKHSPASTSLDNMDTSSNTSTNSSPVKSDSLTNGDLNSSHDTSSWIWLNLTQFFKTVFPTQSLFWSLKHIHRKKIGSQTMVKFTRVCEELCFNDLNGYWYRQQFYSMMWLWERMIFCMSVIPNSQWLTLFTMSNHTFYHAYY